jgi:hypothetical protein
MATEAQVRGIAGLVPTTAVDTSHPAQSTRREDGRYA